MVAFGSDLKIIGRSSAHREWLDKLAKVARTDAEILITGPSGVGKELYAAYAHGKSARGNNEFVVVNCSNLSGELLENELFGHVRGAYTSAQDSGFGLVAAAEGGTLFLDEVDTLPMASQAKLLRFVEIKEYRRLGERRVRRADVRIIAASNANLQELVRAGRFREDLFFRLHVFPLEITSLADRPEDLFALLDHFVEFHAAEYGLEPVAFTSEALDAIERYGWPGNARELENCVRYLTCLQPEEPVTAEALPFCFKDELRASPAAADLDKPLKETKQEMVSEFERRYLDRALRKTNGNVTHAAKNCGKHRRAFFELMRKYGLRSKDYRDST